MKIVGTYSFNDGKEVIEARFAAELRAVEQIIAAIDSGRFKTKISREKTMPGRKLYSPRALNKAFKTEFEERGWHRENVAVQRHAKPL